MPSELIPSNSLNLPFQAISGSKHTVNDNSMNQTRQITTGVSVESPLLLSDAVSAPDISSPSPAVSPSLLSPEKPCTAHEAHLAKRRNKRSLMKLLHIQNDMSDAKSDGGSPVVGELSCSAESLSKLALSPPQSPPPVMSCHDRPMDVYSANMGPSPSSEPPLPLPLPDSGSQDGAHRPQHRRFRPYLTLPLPLPAHAEDDAAPAPARTRYSSLCAWRTARAPILVPVAALLVLRALVMGPAAATDKDDAGDGADHTPDPAWPPAEAPVTWAGAKCGGAAPALPAEPQEGSVEYKWRLLDVTRNKLTQLGTQLRSRMRAGAGRAVFVAGVADEGGRVGCSRADMLATLCVLYACAREGGASMRVEQIWRGGGEAPPRGRSWHWCAADAAKVAGLGPADLPERRAGSPGWAPMAAHAEDCPPAAPTRDTLVCVVSMHGARRDSNSNPSSPETASPIPPGCRCDPVLLNTRTLCPHHAQAELPAPLALPDLLALVRAGLLRDATDVLERRCTGVGTLAENDRAWQSWLELNAWQDAEGTSPGSGGPERSPGLGSPGLVADEPGCGDLTLDMDAMGDSSDSEDESSEDESNEDDD